MIVLENISFQYATNAPLVLRDLSLTIPASTITAILGPNGSGKTTLLHTLLGQLLPMEGEIRLNGQRQRDLSRRSMAQTIGLVPQDENVPFEFTVLEYVVLGRAPYLGWLDTPDEQDYELAQRAISDAGIGHLQDRTIPSLSGGERQLARLARALAQSPKILLLDEPTSHLDLGNQDRVLHLMRTLAQSQVTVIFTTHDPTSAAAVADSLVLLHNGQTVAAGPTREVMTGENLSQVYNATIDVHRVGERLVALPRYSHLARQELGAP